MDVAEQSPSPLQAPRKRKFRIKSKFGLPRQWRSRKSRPCDACRQRKTACVIDTQPPCRYCCRKGIACQATDSLPTPSVPVTPASPGTPDIVSDTDDATPAFTAPDPLQLAQLALPLPSPISVLADAAFRSERSVVTVNAIHDTTTSFTETEADFQPTPIPVISPASVSVSVTRTAHVAVPTPPADPFSAIVNRTDTDIYTLEDNDGLTAHSMGLAGEQDTELLTSFRAAVINEADNVDFDILQVYPGTCGHPGQPPVHFNMIRDEFMPLDNAAKQASSDRIERIVQGCADQLVRLYFKHVHPVYPVVAKTRFLERYAADKQSIPASLRGAVYGIASNFWRGRDTTSATTSPASGHCTTRLSRFDQHELFEQALASLQREMHGPNLWTLQACLLLIHENSAENATVETPRVWMLAAQAVACAQMLGLHRDPAGWQLAGWEKSVRRKLWWAAFAADVWASVCHGNPPHIYPGSFTTTALTMEDVSPGEDVPASLSHMVDEDSMSCDTAVCARFQNTVSMACIVHELLLSSFSDSAYLESMKCLASREAPLLAIRRQLQTWSMLLPRCISIDSASTSTSTGRGYQNQNNAPMHLSYYAAVALNYRALMSPATKAAKQDPASSQRRHFRAAIRDFGSFAGFMDAISPDCLHAFWGLYARSQFILCGNFLIYLFLLAPSHDEVRDAFALLGRFHAALQRLSAVADKFAIGTLRPVALRIDSFFTQAAQVMRTNGQSPR